MEIDFSKLSALTRYAQDGLECDKNELSDTSEHKEGKAHTAGKLGLVGGKEENSLKSDSLENFTIIAFADIEKSRQLQREIIREIREGADEYKLLLKAIEAISVLTGEMQYYNDLKAELQAIHGEALGAQIPLEWALADVQERMRKLRAAAIKNKISQNSKECIKKAITAHQEIEQEIKNKIAEASQYTLDIR